MILATCNLEESKGYQGKLSNGDEKVSLNIKVGEDELKDAFDEALSNRSVFCISVDNWSGKELPEVPEQLKNKVYVMEDKDEVRVSPEGYISYVVLPDGYSNMREVLNICEKAENVRVTGGHLLGINGVRIGRTDKGKEKMLASFNGIYDAFLEVGIKDLDNLEVIKSKLNKRDLDAISGVEVEKEKKAKSGSGKSSGSKMMKSIGTSFGNLFSGEEVDF